MSSNFPSDFEKILLQAMPANEVAPLLDSLTWESHTCIRVNPNKNGNIMPELVLSNLPWNPTSYLLKSRPEFVADPAFHAGYYYVQEASSGVVGFVVAELLKTLESPAIVLDLCAAPGGKSTNISSVIRRGDVLVANEVIQSRTPILNENLSKWGGANHIVTKADSAQFTKCGQMFDIVVADMPCSGEGMFRKDPNSIAEWAPDKIQLCASRQTRIAAQIWDAIKPGGYLLYSTCTYNKRENEENISNICNQFDARVVEFDFPEDWFFYSVEKGMYRLMPHRSPGEGFFFAVIQKPLQNTTIKAVRKPWHKMQKEYAIYDSKNLFLDTYAMFTHGDLVYAIADAEHKVIFDILDKLPGVYMPGTLVGRELKKRYETLLKPDNSLALMAQYPSKLYPEIHLSDGEIIQYLRRESLPNIERKTGVQLVRWGGVKSGFVNGASHVFNNLWPMEWRIRKEGVVAKTIIEMP